MIQNEGKAKESVQSTFRAAVIFFYFIVTEIFTCNVITKFIRLFIQQDSKQVTFLFSKVQALSRFFESLAKDKYLKSIQMH